MTRRNKIDGVNDADIVAIFSIDNTEPPAELDNIVLANTATHVHSNSQTHASGEKDPFLSRYAPLLATTAIIMIAFALTPLVNHEPQTSTQVADASVDTLAEDTSLSASMPMEFAASILDTDAEQEQLMAREFSNQAAAESHSWSASIEAADSDAAPSTNAMATNGISVAARQRTAQAKASSETDSVAASQPISTITENANDSGTANKPDKAYRLSPLLWVIEIKRLFNATEIDSAREELIDFRTMHPDSTHERLLPTQLRSQAADKN